ncbi:MAG: 2-dehydropantoate 2-reductase [Kiritimatiellia bacterium]
MKIVIVGPGAIGSLFAALLSEAGNEVVLLDKDAERARVITSAGLKIEDTRETRVVKVPASAQARELARPDAVFLCVKAYDTDSALLVAEPVLSEGVAIVSLQNGAGNVERIASTCPGVPVLCCCTAQGATSMGTGHVRHAGSGLTRIAPRIPESSRQTASEIAAVLAGAGIPTETSEDCLSLVWSKLVINAAINPLTAISNVRNGYLVYDEKLKKQLHRAAQEAAAVARAKGATLAYEDAGMEAERICRETAENFSSMVQDLRKKKKTEIDFINGIVVKEGQSLGIPVELNERLAVQVSELERKQS